MIVETQLRATLFHEFHHLVRDANVPSRSLMDRAVTEGMATAFERDFAGADAPWGKYPDNVSDWVAELWHLGGSPSSRTPRACANRFADAP